MNTDRPSAFSSAQSLKAVETGREVLRAFPGALNELLRHLPQSWAHRNEGGGSWTVYQIVAHLIRSERVNWIDRARMILQEGETRIFPPFQRPPDIAEGKPLSELLDEFAAVRAGTLAQLEALQIQPEDFERTGRHPDFGTVTLSQLLATWVAHDLTHLHQISRVMAHQYREQVGPWRKFLGVLHCEGHSE